MPAILFHCPTTGLSVQGWVVDDPSAHPKYVERYELVTCPSCMHIRLINPKTGEVLIEKISKTCAIAEKPAGRFMIRPAQGRARQGRAKLAADPGETAKLERQLKAAKTQIMNLRAQAAHRVENR